MIMPGKVLGSGDTEVNKKGKSLQSLYFGQEIDNKQTLHVCVCMNVSKKSDNYKQYKGMEGNIYFE